MRNTQTHIIYHAGRRGRQTTLSFWVWLEQDGPFEMEAEWQRLVDGQRWWSVESRKSDVILYYSTWEVMTYLTIVKQWTCHIRGHVWYTTVSQPLFRTAQGKITQSFFIAEPPNANTVSPERESNYIKRTKIILLSLSGYAFQSNFVTCCNTLCYCLWMSMNTVYECLWCCHWEETKKWHKTMLLFH